MYESPCNTQSFKTKQKLHYEGLSQNIFIQNKLGNQHNLQKHYWQNNVKIVPPLPPLKKKKEKKWQLMFLNKIV